MRIEIYTIIIKLPIIFTRKALDGRGSACTIWTIDCRWPQDHRASGRSTAARIQPAVRACYANEANNDKICVDAGLCCRLRNNSKIIGRKTLARTLDSKLDQIILIMSLESI